MWHRTRQTAFALVSLFLCSVSAQAATYQFTAFDAPSALDTFPSDIDNAGRIAGILTELPATIQRAFIREVNGAISVFDVPGTSTATTILTFSGSGATGINDAGQLAGIFSDGTHIRGFVRAADGTTYTDFDVPGFVNMFTGAMNASGAVVGAATNSTGIDPPDVSFTSFLRNPDGTFTIFDVPGAINSGTQAGGINDNGDIVGFFEDAVGTHGFLRETGGAFTILDVPGAVSTLAFGIDDLGRIVGSFDDALGKHGFLRDGVGTYTTINVPGEMSTTVAGITMAGELMGTFLNATGTSSRGFVALLVPEPATLSLVLLGIAGLRLRGFGARSDRTARMLQAEVVHPQSIGVHLTNR